MHSLTYTQKSCRQNVGSRDAYVYMRTFFATRKPQQANQRAESKKCIHYIYTKYPFFIFKKCIHYIYTRNHISSRQQYFQRPSHYSPTPQICRQQAEIGQITTNHYCSSTPHSYPHFAGSRIKYTTQQSQATTMQPLQYIKKRYMLTQPQAYTYFFAHFSRFLQNVRQGAYIRPEKKKKRKMGVKRC